MGYNKFAFHCRVFAVESWRIKKRSWSSDSSGGSAQRRGGGKPIKRGSVVPQTLAAPESTQPIQSPKNPAKDQGRYTREAFLSSRQS